MTSQHGQFAAAGRVYNTTTDFSSCLPCFNFYHSQKRNLTVFVIYGLNVLNSESTSSAYLGQTALRIVKALGFKGYAIELGYHGIL